MDIDEDIEEAHGDGESIISEDGDVPRSRQSLRMSVEKSVLNGFRICCTRCWNCSNSCKFTSFSIGGEFYPICSTQTGHFWFRSQCCGDKASSELTRYGPGISRYFKWLMWLTVNFFFYT